METYLIELEISENLILNTRVTGIFQQGQNGDPNQVEYNHCCVEDVIINGVELSKTHPKHNTFETLAEEYIRDNIFEIEDKLLGIHYGGY